MTRRGHLAMPAAVAAGFLALGLGACTQSRHEALANDVCGSVAGQLAAPGKRVDLGALTAWIPDGWSIEDPGYFDHGGLRLGPKGELGLSNAYVGPESFGDNVTPCSMTVNGLSVTIHAFEDGGMLSVAAVVGKEGDFEGRMRPLLSADDATGQQLGLFLSALHSLERGSSSALRNPKEPSGGIESVDRGEHPPPAP